MDIFFQPGDHSAQTFYWPDSNGGHRLIFLPGVHIVSPIYLTGDNLTIMGSGANNTILNVKWPANFPDDTKINGIYGLTNHTTIKDITLDMKWQENGSRPRVGACGIIITGDWNVIQDCIIKNTAGFWPNGSNGAVIWQESWAALTEPPYHADAMNNSIIRCTAMDFYGNYCCGFYVGLQPNTSVYKQGGGETRDCLVIGSPWVGFSQVCGLMKGNRTIDCGFGYRNDTGVFENFVMEGNVFTNCKSHGVMIDHDGWEMFCKDDVAGRNSVNVVIMNNSISIAPTKPEGINGGTVPLPINARPGSRGILLHDGGRTNRKLIGFIAKNNVINFMGERIPDEYALLMDSNKFINAVFEGNASNRSNWNHFSDPSFVDRDTPIATTSIQIPIVGSTSTLSMFAKQTDVKILGRNKKRTDLMMEVAGNPPKRIDYIQ